MSKKLLLLLAVASTCFADLTKVHTEKDRLYDYHRFIDEITSFANAETPYSKPLYEIKEMLHREAPTLSHVVMEKIITTLKCERKYNVEHNNVLTVIDYSLPSSEKRLWIFDLNANKLLFHTYVSHGIKSGQLLSNYFSNKYNSKASSIGVYKTEKPYYGRHGLSLKLDGLDYGFNDNAANRSIVMHGGWYVEEHFIKKYGRAGRSWGCPAVPTDLTAPIINTIKENSIFVMYFPSDTWFLKSKFLNCERLSPILNTAEIKPVVEENEQREEILYTTLGKNSKSEENQAVVTVSADNYERIFHNKAPLTRMLRRQIDNMEYIALSKAEFKTMVTNNPLDNENLNAVNFVAPVVKMQRGYYATEMKIIHFGKIKEVTFNKDASSQKDATRSFTVYFEEKSAINLKTTDRFIRWLGL